MSNAHIVEAKLPGFEGPYFPDRIVRGRSQGLRRLQKRFGYHPERIYHMLLDRVAERLPDGSVQMHPRTSDGYLATGLVEFEHEGTRFGVLFPMLHDTDKTDGTYADRSAALYAAEPVDEDTQLRAMTAFVKVFVKVYKEKYSNAIRHSKEANGVT